VVSNWLRASERTIDAAAAKKCIADKHSSGVEAPSHICITLQNSLALSSEPRPRIIEFRNRKYSFDAACVFLSMAVYFARLAAIKTTPAINNKITIIRIGNILKLRSQFRIAYGAAFVALTAVCAQIAIPLPPVPWTLQTFSVLLAGGIAGSAVGATSQLAYILLGLIGVPVFAGLRGGPQVVLSPSFGYVLAFPIAAIISGLFDPKQGKIRRSPIPFILALIPVYIVGPAYLYFIAPIALGKRLPLSGVIAAGVLPFIIPDIIKALLAWILSARLSRFMRK